MPSNQISQLIALSAIASPLAMQSAVNEPVQFEEASLFKRE